jgi:hypothetical protein
MAKFGNKLIQVEAGALLPDFVEQFIFIDVVHPFPLN